MLKEKTKIEQLAEEVLTFSRNTLLVNLRFLDMALNQLKLQSTDSSTMMTDGQFVFYEPRNVLTKYKTQHESIAHDYLHMVLHCVYRHLLNLSDEWIEKLGRKFGIPPFDAYRGKSNNDCGYKEETKHGSERENSFRIVPRLRH